MRNISILFAGFLLLALVPAQAQLGVPEVTKESNQEVLYMHVIAYSSVGIDFAKTQGVSPKEYGEFIGKKFIPFWDPSGGFPLFAGQTMYILANMHPDNEMQIIEQDDGMIKFKMKNVNAMFMEGAAFGITYSEFLECSEGILSTLAEFMKVDFTHRMIDDTWYEVTLNAQPE